MNIIKICTILLFVIATLVLLVGCSKDSKANTIFSPDQVTTSTADWMLIAGNWLDPSGKSLQSILVTPTGNLIDFLDYTLEVKIDGVTLPLAHDNEIPVWSGTADLNAGQTYEFHVITTNNITGSIKEFTASATMVYDIEAQFPNPYHLTTTAPLTWTLAHDSQYQQIYITSTSPTDQTNEFEKRVDSSARSYTIPANCVQDFGTGSTITMQVNEFNYVKSGRLALFTASSDMANYPQIKNQAFDRKQMMVETVLSLKQWLQTN